MLVRLPLTHWTRKVLLSAAKQHLTGVLGCFCHSIIPGCCCLSVTVSHCQSRWTSAYHRAFSDMKPSKPENVHSHIRFDWAMKRLLRNQSNYDVLEGFLSEVLQHKITINHIAESETNRDAHYQKYCQYDILAKTESEELIIVEVQVRNTDHIMKRAVFGVSKCITDRMKAGMKYSTVPKVYSVNVIYHDLGIGEEYIHDLCPILRSREMKQELRYSGHEQCSYRVKVAGLELPEYIFIRLEAFKGEVKNHLDQWLFYLKNNEIKDEFDAPGIDKARSILRCDQMSVADYAEYEAELKWQADRDSEVEKALNIRASEVAIELFHEKFTAEKTAKITKLSTADVETIWNEAGLFRVGDRLN